MEHTENKVMVGSVGDPNTTSFEAINALPQSERLVLLEDTPELPVSALLTK